MTVPPPFDTSSENKIWHIITTLHRSSYKKRKERVWRWNTHPVRLFIFCILKTHFQGNVHVKYHIVLLENRQAIMHILIIIHVLQNGTRWLPFITVVEGDNLFLSAASRLWTLFWHHWTCCFCKLTNYQRFSEASYDSSGFVTYELIQRWLFKSLETWQCLPTHCH